MKFLILIFLIFCSMANAGDFYYKPPPPQPTIHNSCMTAECQAAEKSGNNSANTLFGSAVGDIACNAFISHISSLSGTQSKIFCGFAVMFAVSMREDPDYAAGLAGIGTGSLISYSWKF